MKIFRVKNAYTNFLLIIAIPFLGIIYILFIYLFKAFIKSDNGNYLIDKENEYDRNISLLIREAELKNKKDLIPIEDALNLNDHTIKRNLVIEMLKEDSYKYLEFLLKALKDEDSETSHYAATAITQLKSKLTVAIQDMEVEYYKNSKNKEVSKEYIKALKECIDSNLIDKKERTRLTYSYKLALENYIRDIEDDENYLNELIKIYIDIKNYDKAIIYSYKYMKKFVQSYKPYMFLLEVYYTLNDKKNFEKVIKSLRESDIKLDKEGLDILRFWIEGDNSV
ncbi:hypothetical protein PN290_01685 [Romboutsia sp. 1001216sp1]|uniref:hypothetical protein n=2 Tax=Romboutsia TaxID=1501226 RepID=UPI0018ABA5AF|nr:hypothetical protein [Romboutsia sp. 1001216sp1]MDB8794819.1 hypothetical protein [Romboutsia sp. 1001216sp1]MDB8798078.1 hypothetical protein [Romboutsia sp. 1001216sp1]